MSEIVRQRTNLTTRLALIDDDQTAAPFLVEIETLTWQHRQRELRNLLARA